MAVLVGRRSGLRCLDLPTSVNELGGFGPSVSACRPYAAARMRGIFVDPPQRSVCEGAHVSYPPRGT